MSNTATPTGWQARLHLDFGLRGNKTRLINKSQYGPLTLQRPFYPEGETCHNYILHPPGGVVGGDSLQIHLNARQGTRTLLTTPGATKFYRSGADLVSLQSLDINVAQGATLEWLPQQNIFFPGARAQLDTRVDVARGGKFVAWEMHCFGRPANEERFLSGRVRSRTRVSVAGELRLIEQLNTTGEQTLAAATGLRGFAMQGSLIAAPCSEIERATLVRILQGDSTVDYPPPVGLSLVDEVLVVRALGAQAEVMQALFTRLWDELRGLWLQRSPCAPRIWAT